MRTKAIVALGLALSLLLGVTVAVGNGSAAVQSQDWGKKSGHPGEGELDWTTGVIQSTGIGVINPKAVNVGQARAGCVMAATRYAQRNLLEMVQGVNIDSQTTVENFMTTSDVIRTNVSGVLRGAYPIGEPVYKADGSCEVTYAMKVSGALANAILPPSGFGGQQNAVPAGPQKKYSGLIIDATGLGAVPAMAPKILDPDGKEVYGSAFISRDYAVEQGVVGYAKNVDQAKQNERVGGSPLIVRGVKVSGAKSADVIISKDDAAKLQDSNLDLGFLKECRVIIVL